MNVAFLTAADLAGGHHDDRLVVAPAAALGITIEFVPWKEPRSWGDFDAVVIRTPWDYQHSPERFLRTLDEIEEVGTPLWNPSQIVRWNFDKGYLAELARRGLPVVPSEFLRADSAEAIRGAGEGLGAEKIVVKPRVGASGQDTFLLAMAAAGSEASWAEAERALQGREVVVQPFMPRVLTEGELSLIVLDGEPSHVIRKLPQGGEFRSQEELGGNVTGIAAPDYLNWAMGFLKRVPEAAGSFYARVDAIRADEGDWLLGELELIEPQLYLRCGEGAAERFVAALAKRLGLQGPNGNRRE